MEVLDFSLRPAARRSCRVRVGAGALDGLVADLVSDPPGGPLVVVADENVAPLHARPLEQRLLSAGLDAELLTFPAGESSKSRLEKSSIEDRMLALGADRNAAIVAVGGGVTGDLAGYVAATWHRGIPVVQVPTSLLAMVDSSIGGKTAINLPEGKNLVGAFHQPWGIYADVSVLSTLAERDYVDGFAEVVKAAAIADGKLFRSLEDSVEPLRSRDAARLESTIRRCMEIKIGVVRRDERESGRRAMLNFGHTVGHAIEAASGYRWRHGPAVAVGMVIEARLAQSELGFPAAHVRRLEGLLESLGLPVRPPDELGADAIVTAARRDKKTRSGRLHFALPTRLGRMPAGDRVTRDVGEAILVRALEA